MLADDYDIQLNKTSRNSVLLQTNINNTRSDIAQLIKVLVEISQGIEKRLADGGSAAQQAFAARVKSLMTDVPNLPNFTCFFQPFPGRHFEHNERRECARRSFASLSRKAVRAHKPIPARGWTNV